LQKKIGGVRTAVLLHADEAMMGNQPVPGKLSDPAPNIAIDLLHVKTRNIVPGVVIHAPSRDMKAAAIPADGAVAEEREAWRRFASFERGQCEGDIAGWQKGGYGNVIMIRRFNGARGVESEGAPSGKQVKPACIREGDELRRVDRVNGASAPARGGQFRPIGNHSFAVGHHGYREISHGMKG